MENKDNGIRSIKDVLETLRNDGSKKEFVTKFEPLATSLTTVEYENAIIEFGNVSDNFKIAYGLGKLFGLSLKDNIKEFKRTVSTVLNDDINFNDTQKELIVLMTNDMLDSLIEKENE